MDWSVILIIALLCGITILVIVIVLHKSPEISPEKIFTPEWIEILQEKSALYRILPEQYKPELHSLISKFISSKTFEGCAGLVITDEIRLIIAMNATVLLLNKTFDCYPLLHSVLVYPSAFYAEDIDLYDNQCVRGGFSQKVGESWQNGDVILAWDAVSEESRRIRMGRNSAIHEFAHQLDQDNGAADGIPVIRDRRAWLEWQKIFQFELKKFRRNSAAGIPDVLDEYGAVDEAEFFAVASETFFSLPAELAQRHPRLYRELKHFYQLDPRRWYKTGTYRCVPAFRRN